MLTLMIISYYPWPYLLCFRLMDLLSVSEVPQGLCTWCSLHQKCCFHQPVPTYMLPPGRHLPWMFFGLKKPPLIASPSFIFSEASISFRSKLLSLLSPLPPVRIETAHPSLCSSLLLIPDTYSIQCLLQNKNSINVIVYWEIIWMHKSLLMPPWKLWAKDWIPF